MTIFCTPPGWPDGVLPPGVSGWEESATGYLFDCCPADFRGYRVLRNHPVVLAQFARQFVESQHRSMQEGVAEVRTTLRRRVAAEVVEQAVQVWLEQQARLARTRRAVGLIEEALRGRVFVPKL